MKKVSVIIPAYNMEKRIGICLDSILKQRYENLEVIIIDDGSTDKTKEICEEYACQDKRIKVISRSNGGVAEATNTGLNQMSGDYVLFVDSDDYIESDTIYEMVKQMESSKADIVQCGAKLETESGEELVTEYKSEQIILGVEEIMKKHLVELVIGGNLAQKLFRAKLFQDIRMPRGRNLADTVTMLGVLTQCETYKIIPNVFYVAVKRNDSVSMAPLNDKVYDDILFYIESLNKLDGLRYSKISWCIKYAELKMWIMCYNRVCLSGVITNKKQKMNYLTQNYNYKYDLWEKNLRGSELPRNGKVKMKMFRFNPQIYTMLAGIKK